MTSFRSRDSLNCLETLTVGDKAYAYCSLKAAEQTLGDLSHLPFCLRILLENLLRNEDGEVVTVETMRSLCAFHALRRKPPPFSFRPIRLLIEERTARSIVADLAAMREAQIREKDDPALFVLSCEADVAITEAPNGDMDPKAERTTFLRWGAAAFPALRVIPPGKGRSCVLNTNTLTRVVTVQTAPDGTAPLALPDTVLGENARLSLSGALGCLVLPSNSLDLETVLLGGSLPFAFPGILGVKLTGKRQKNVKSVDIALALLKAVRQNNGKGKMVEFFGPGLDHLSVQDRLVIADILNESDVVSTFFPIDDRTIAHLTEQSGDAAQTALVETYAKAQGLWRESFSQAEQQTLSFTAEFEFSFDSLRPSLGGPGMAYNPVSLAESGSAFLASFPAPKTPPEPLAVVKHGDIAWVSLGPFGGAFHLAELVEAALEARKAREKGLTIKPWVRAVLDIRDPVLNAFLAQTGLGAELEAIGFMRRKEGEDSSRVQDSIAAAVKKGGLAVCALATGPASKETPFPPNCAATYIASPIVIVAYALTGTIIEPLHGKMVAPSEEVTALFAASPLASLYRQHRQSLFDGDALWQSQAPENKPLFSWNELSIFIKKPSILETFSLAPPKLENIANAKLLAVFGADVPASAMAPSGAIAPDSPAGRFLLAQGVMEKNLGRFKDYSGNEQVMLRGAFAGKELKNALSKEGGEPLFEVAARFNKAQTPLLLAARQNYGCGDVGQEWAAKATRLLGVKAVMAESFDPAHRLNLIRMGILPLQLKTGVTIEDLKLDGQETVSFAGITDIMRPPAEVMATVTRPDSIERYMLLCRLDTEEEVETWRHGSLWAETIRNLILLAG